MVRCFNPKIKGKSDDELEELIFSKMEGVRVDSSHPENVADFFDEDFPEYRGNNDRFRTL